MKIRRFLLMLLIPCLLGGLLQQPVRASQSTQLSQVEQLLSNMTPAEKVGQLALVTFEGTDASDDSKIAELISDYNIGGVVLSAEMNNFTQPDTLLNIQSLVSDLQTLAWQKSQLTAETLPATLNSYIPLYIGISRSGKSTQAPQIQEGITQLPTAMTIGATWSTNRAFQVGEVIGQELSALGFNLYLGPALDVVDTRDLTTAAYFGTRSFGGDPYWVGELGKAAIKGIHAGSNNRMSVIAQHFPGLGGADRPPLEEVSTIQKSLEQLKQIELAPFITVISDPDTISQADGLMISHIRFQGLQGNIRATTKPVSFDQAALEQLLAVEPIAQWRENGGLTLSESLGSRAVRLFFDPTGSNFDAFSIARTAFLAGNDLLYMDDFLEKGDTDNFETIRRTLDLFSQKYEEDQVFAQRVDQAVSRILADKLALYGEFTPENVLTTADLSEVGQSGQVSFAVQLDAVTLISPQAEFLNTVLPEPPVISEYITIFTDTRVQQQCETCPANNDLGTTSFETALLNLYGPQGTNQITDNRVSSYSFTQLLELLDQATDPSDPFLPDNLNLSSWVIFNLQGVDASIKSSNALRRLLAERADLLRDKKVIVFAYGAPYYLDSTEIAKVTAYYALYNKTSYALDVAARALMQEVPMNGSLPVSLGAVGYDLNLQTSPHPDQVIPIALLGSMQSQTPTPQLTPTPETTASPSSEETPMPLFRTGETVRIQAGPIIDHNRHSVPDGTVVRFTVRLAGDVAIIAQPEVTTIGGLAVVEYQISREGIFEVTATSDPAMTSARLVLNTSGGSAELILPTATATASPTPPPEPTLTITPLPTQNPTPSTTPDPSLNTTGYPRMTDWLLVLLILIFGYGMAFIIGFYWWGGQTWGIRSGLCSMIGGLIAYIPLTLGFDGLINLVKTSGSWFVVEVVLLGMLFGWMAALIWWMRKASPFKSPKS